MDEPRKPPEPGSLPLQGPHWHRAPEGERPPAFQPLRLLLPRMDYRIEITRPVMVLGRHTDSDVRLPLPDVSRHHCRFVFQGGTWEVIDLNSLNGVYVNGHRVKRAALHSHDVLGLGGLSFQVELGEAAPTVHVPAEDPRNTEEILQSIANALPEAAEGPGVEKRRAS